MSRVKTASVPTSGDAGRQGRQASPPNPSKNNDHDVEKLTAKMDLRCTIVEKEMLQQQAKAAGVSPSQLLREALGLVEVRCRKPVPTVAPEIIRAVSQASRDLQILAREAHRNPAAKLGQQSDRLTLIAAIVAVDRRLSQFFTLEARDHKC